VKKKQKQKRVGLVNFKVFYPKNKPFFSYFLNYYKHTRFPSHDHLIYFCFLNSVAQNLKNELRIIFPLEKRLNKVRERASFFDEEEKQRERKHFSSERVFIMFILLLLAFFKNTHTNITPTLVQILINLSVFVCVSFPKIKFIILAKNQPEK